MKLKDLFTYKEGGLFSKPHYEVNWTKIDHIAPFAELHKTQQSSVWHQEGDAFTHTKMVTKAMEKLLKKQRIDPTSDYWIMMMSAELCHDLGKGCATKWNEDKKEWECKRHGFHSARIIRTLFQDEDFELREKVCFIARHHMTLHHIFDKAERISRALINLSLGPVNVADMILLKEADSLGSKNDEETPKSVAEMSEAIRIQANYLNCLERPYEFDSDVCNLYPVQSGKTNP